MRKLLVVFSAALVSIVFLRAPETQAQGCIAAYDLTVSQGDWSLRYTDSTRWTSGVGFEENGATTLFVKYIFGENRYISRISWYASGSGTLYYNQPTGWNGTGSTTGITSNKALNQYHTVTVNQTLPGILFWTDTNLNNTVLSYIEIDYCASTSTPQPTATATPPATATPSFEETLPPPFILSATPTRTPFLLPSLTPLPLATASGGNFAAFVTQQWMPEARTYGWDVPAISQLVTVTAASAPTVDPTRGAIVNNMSNLNSTLEAQMETLLTTPSALDNPDGTAFNPAAQDEEFENLLLLLFSYIKGLDPEDWGQLAPLITLTTSIFIYMVFAQAFNIVWRILTTIFAVVFSLLSRVISFLRG